ncbi:unnamed protein product [Darwinula stevensoni]|uniref:Mos1 transposase HTH domain-containing protein n=1 Tax=Darwinula stevensoni TaxID=69355 RepID=A0A7R9AD55_9CRUS|nr:unnamed protein product [Darwinula stevensoni]CAG0900799.1 unnamed protein product [Darwinula stevensoni]
MHETGANKDQTALGLRICLSEYLLHSTAQEEQPHVPTPAVEKSFMAQLWGNFDVNYMKPFLTHSRPTLLDTVPVCCLPLARVLTSTRQLTQEEQPHVPTPAVEKSFMAQLWGNFDVNYMKPFLTHSRPTLLDTVPVCCLPLARVLTSTRQLTQEGCEAANDPDDVEMGGVSLISRKSTINSISQLAAMAPIKRATLRPIVYYEFLQGHSARAAADNICATFKGNVVHYSTPEEENPEVAIVDPSLLVDLDCPSARQVIY